MTTSYERLREECNKRLPVELGPNTFCAKCDEEWCRCSLNHTEQLTITDVLRVLAATRPKATSFYIEDDGNLWQCTAPLGDNLLCTFNLSLSLSAPENEAACEAVLSIITETV